MLRVIELILGLAVFVLLFTQVLIPALMNRKLFPLFRKAGKIEQEIVEVRQSQYEEALLEDLDAEKLKLEEMKQSHIESQTNKE